MTMAEMDKYLRDKGFSVDRKYVPERESYRFTIRKDKDFYESYFKYPGRDNWSERDRKQKVFLDKLVRDFELAHPKTMASPNIFMHDLYANEAPCKLLINGNLYPITITEATFEHSINSEPTIEIEGSILGTNPTRYDPLTLYMAARGNGKTNFIRTMMNSVYGSYAFSGTPFLEIEKVIFNYPATIVIWKDGTKTVVKAQNDEVFDKEKGLVMAMIKKTLGNEGNYYEQIKKWL